MPPTPPPNSASQTSSLRRPIHIHVVDEFNLDSSLEVASTMLASSHLASCDQIRISTSGLHPSLSLAHPKLSSSSSNHHHQYKYGETKFVQLQPILDWSNEKLERYSLVTSGPRHFLSVERKSVGKGLPFDLVVCCSREVFDGVCQYYSSRSFQMHQSATATSKNEQNANVSSGTPQSVFIIFIDSKHFRTLGGNNGSNNNNNNISQNKPTQGLLLTSLITELLDLVHLKTVSQGRNDINNDDDDGAAANDRENSNNNNITNNFVPQHVVNGTGEKWKEDFAKSVKQFEQLRRIEVMFRPFVV